MFDFGRVGQEAVSATKKAAEDSRRRGLPVVTFDRDSKQVIKTWPDGQVEIVPVSVKRSLEKNDKPR